MIRTVGGMAGALLEQCRAFLGAIPDRRMRLLTLIVLAIQAVGTVVAIGTLLMLYADGTWFGFVLSARAPWALNWSGISARATVYILTVWPTLLLSQLGGLGPLDTVRLNAFFFYGSQCALYAVAAALVWRRHPRSLVYPALQFIAGLGLSYGFPSEILISASLLWVSLFLVTGERPAGPLSILAYVALVFSHELALPAILVVAWLGITAFPANKRLMPALAFGLPIAAFFVVRALAGGAGSDMNAIYVFDVHRILRNPILLTTIGAWLLIGMAALVLRRGRSDGLFALLAVVATVIALAVAFGRDANFAVGLYPARSITAAAMAVLAILFAYDRRTGRSLNPTPAQRPAAAFALIAAALAITVVAHAAFLADWTAALVGTRRVIAPVPGQAPQLIGYDAALAEMTPREARGNLRANMRDFQWIMPYRSMLLADGAVPGRIVQGNLDEGEQCRKMRMIDRTVSLVPAAALDLWQRIACTAPPPTPRRSLIERLRGRLHGRSFFG